jgi:hypothetical protein
MGSSRPSFKYNSITKRWEVRGKSGTVKASFGDNSLTKVTQLEVGATGDNFTKMYKFVATLSAALTLGSGVVGVGTLQSATGSGVGCAELAVGDTVFGNPKTALGSVLITGFHVPTTNTLNVYCNPRIAAAGGSLAEIGFDVVAFR